MIGKLVELARVRKRVIARGARLEPPAGTADAL